MKELKVIYHADGVAHWLATLADDGRDVLFQYSPDALARQVALSPVRLPLRAAAYPDRQSDYLRLLRVPGLVYDSLPDGWGFHLMNRQLKTMGIDPERVSVLDRLAYLGDNTMGALTYEPSTGNNKNDHQALTLQELAQEISVFLADDSHAVLAELARAGASPGGARPKALLDFDPVGGQMSTQAGRVLNGQAWLVKFPAKEDAPDCCALEELYARMARKGGLGMGATQFFELEHGLTAFGTQRFDRLDGRRLHVHSLAGMLHADFQTPALAYLDFMRVTRMLTRDERELKKSLQRCVFNVLMNNRDDHAKNLAFLHQENSESTGWTLAPPFDLTYCPGYRGEHFMDVAGEGKLPTRAHVLKLAQDAGLKERAAADIIDAMLDLITDADIKRAADALPIRKKTVADVAAIIDVNRSRLAAS